MLKRRAFTLIELLVVIGIIALLLSILIPAVSRVRFNAKCALCAANLRQVGAAMSHYATDNGGWFPLYQTPYQGGSALDLCPQFTNLLSGVYRIPKSSMYCPFQDDDILRVIAVDPYDIASPPATILQFGYLTWIPRWNGNWYLAPPLVPGSYPNEFQYPQPLDPTPFAGPQRMSDSTAKDNPLFTDLVSSEAPAPSTARATDPGNTISWFSNHEWHSRLENINAAFADGHVEAIMGSAVHPRYAAGRLCWR